MDQVRWSLVLIALVVACGGHPKAQQAATASGCEPGRCLDDLAKVIEKHRVAARACYDQAHKGRTAAADGRLIINFEIDRAGKVVDASQGVQSNQIADEAVVACVIDIVKTIQFAASAGGKSTRAFHQFTFSAH